MTRILTAIFLILVLAAALWLPPAAFVVVLVAFLLLAWDEYARLAASAGAAPLRGLGAALAAVCAVSFAAPAPATPLVTVALAALLAAVGGLAAGRRNPALAIRRAGATVGGVCWLGLLPGFYVALRFQPNGVALIVMLIAAVSSGDIAAYYGGRSFGKHPLAAHLSPKKTVEGGVCGLLASASSAALATYYLLPGASLPRAALVGVAVGAVAQAGDLFESSLKRSAGTKDSSTLLPGHGGVLDRLDGLLFGGAVLYAAVFFELL